MPSASDRVVEPVGAVPAGEAEDQRIDEPPLRIEHEADRQDGRDRGYCPRQDEEQRQPFDPRARRHEEARKDQCYDHLEVDADDHERERVVDRAEEDRIVEQLLVTDRMTCEPQAIPDRVEHEDQENHDIRGEEDQPPFLPGRQTFLRRAGRQPLHVGKSQRGHLRVCSYPAEPSGWAGAAPEPTPRSHVAGNAGGRQPATCLMRAIISSVAFSTETLSLTTRLMAFAQTFSLLRIVNL